MNNNNSMDYHQLTYLSIRYIFVLHLNPD